MRGLTARDDDEETKTEYCCYTELLLEFHLQAGDHGYGEDDYDDVGEDVDFLRC